MNKTGIEYVDRTWNPITGCFHDCPYCYARGIARRFGTQGINTTDVFQGSVHEAGTVVLHEPYIRDGNAQPYPFGFAPTFHRYRLTEPENEKKPQRIFVGSMADMFGKWVPDEWIQAVFDACAAAPWHTYLFLTKNPERYYQVNNDDDETTNLTLHDTPALFGATVTNNDEMERAYESLIDWVSIEPLHGRISKEWFMYNMCTDSFEGPADGEIARWAWVVIGAETGNRRDKIKPERTWIEEIVETCRFWGTPVFMKDNLVDVWGDALIQEYPWEEGHHGPDSR